MSGPSRITVGLAQTDVVLGDRPANLERHRGWVHRAREAGVQLLVFPELSLTGYFLKDLVSEAATTRDSDTMRSLAELSKEVDLVAGLVLHEPDHRYFNVSAYFSQGRLVHIHRKVYLFTYGMSEEGRDLAAGDRFRSFAVPFGRAGILVCEDIWHLSSAYILSLQGVDLIICPSASPGRGVSAQEHLGTADSYNLVCRTYAQFLTTYFVFCNRVGYEDGVNFWGGSMVIGPQGEVMAKAENADETLVTATLDLGEVRRQRLATPLLRDERLELTINELRRVWHERSSTPY